MSNKKMMCIGPDGQELTVSEAADLVIEHISIDDNAGSITLNLIENNDME